MFIELVDALRCPNDHEDTWLVAAVEEFRGRYIARGSLGCPICHAQYRIENGEADFVGGTRPANPARTSRPVSEDDLLRTRAFLNLVEPGGLVALVGSAAALATALAANSQNAVLLVNPSGAALEPGVSTLWIAERLPMAAGSLRAAMVGDPDQSAAVVRSLVDALRTGARLVAPSAMPVPPGITELARDERQWVGAKTEVQSSGLLQLQRG
ncbi:MAG: hypothetical protein ACT4P7_24095 [Gemmatimonadaceae bacterium]